MKIAWILLEQSVQDAHSDLYLNKVFVFQSIHTALLLILMELVFHATQDMKFVKMAVLFRNQQLNHTILILIVIHMLQMELVCLAQVHITLTLPVSVLKLILTVSPAILQETVSHVMQDTNL